jgi:hypothetical protein
MRRVLPLDFDRTAGYVMPKDPVLHHKAIEFAQKELAEIPNFADYARVWLSVDVDDKEKPVSVHGALGFVMRPDIVLCRSLDRKAMVGLYLRANAYLADNGARGYEALVYINPDEAPEQKCPQQKESLAALNMKPANRWAITVR